MQPVYVDGCTCHLWEGDELAPEPKVLGHYFTCLRIVSFYSEDIAAAMTLVDWADAHGFAISIHKSPSGLWHVFFFKFDHRPWHSESGKTIEEAICLAFLAAMGKEDR